MTIDFSFYPPCAVESCSTPGEIPGSFFPFFSFSGVNPMMAHNLCLRLSNHLVPHLSCLLPHSFSPPKHHTPIRFCLEDVVFTS